MQMQILGIDILTFLVIAPALSALIVLLIPGGKQVARCDRVGSVAADRRVVRGGVRQLRPSSGRLPVCIEFRLVSTAGRDRGMSALTASAPRWCC